MWLVLRFEVSIASVDIPPGNVHGAQRSKGAQMRIYLMASLTLFIKSLVLMPKSIEADM
jgi:hypothetical protein